MVDVGTHKSLDDPPGIPAFCGRQKSSNSNSTVHALTEMAKNITSISAAPNKPDLCASTSISPGKVANLRASYLQQLRDLYQLFDCGAITQSEFIEQKKPILDQLTKLKP
ncbi:uncharacterized protein [Dysidea avara]|uniref:uncharacterized protein n=1 Tax=Dysidea avara TaxID=196820 RepID=UPI003330BCAC